MLAITATLTGFTGPTAHVSVTVTGALGPIDLTYHWDDGTTTSHPGVPVSGGALTDSADHAYAPYDYDTFGGPGQNVGAHVAADDPTAAVLIESDTIPLPIPEAFLDVTPDRGSTPLHATLTATELTPYPPGVTDDTYDWDDSSGWTQTTTVPTVVHTFTTPSTYLTRVRVTNSVGWSHHAFVDRPIVTGVARLRQFPRDDFLGGAPRQGKTNGATSTQGSARQGWRGTYR